MSKALYSIRIVSPLMRSLSCVRFPLQASVCSCNACNLFTVQNLVLCARSLVAVPFITLGINLLLPVSNILLVAHLFLMATPSATLAAILCQRPQKNLTRVRGQRHYDVHFPRHIIILSYTSISASK